MLNLQARFFITCWRSLTPSPSLHPFHHLIGWSHPCLLCSMTTNKHINHIVYLHPRDLSWGFDPQIKLCTWHFGTISQRHLKLNKNLRIYDLLHSLLFIFHCFQLYRMVTLFLKIGAVLIFTSIISVTKYA